MTFITHGLAGAALMLALFNPTPLSGTFWALLIYGLIAGSAPDTLDWFMAELKLVPRYSSIYGWWHHSGLALLISVILIAPLPHVLGDKFIHVPVLPRKGENPYMDEILIQKPFGLSRHDIIWLLGELMMFLFFIILLGVYLWP